jgi:D-alanine-D-alanine ligase
MAQAEKTAEKAKKPAGGGKANGHKQPTGKVELALDKKALKKLRLVAVAYSHVEREWFPTEDAYLAEKEVEERAQEVIQELEKLGIPAKGYPGDQYLITNLLVDKPDLVLNLVDTLRGKDSLQTSVPAALELANIPYTGADMQGLVIGNNRNLTKQLLDAFTIPTPSFQFIRRAGTAVDQNLGLPLIVKLNESGGSVGINNTAVKETFEDAQKQVDDLISTYKLPVIVEQFVEGPEITAVVFEDGKKRHVFLGEKVFRSKPDGKHYFTSLESYNDARSYTYKPVEEAMANKIIRNVQRAFGALMHRDYAKFDIRVDENSGTAYVTDSNPNTAFGPDLGLPMTEVLEMNGVQFQSVLASMMSKYAKKIE